MMTPTKAISVHAPWAWALMFGGKDVENRSARHFPRNLGKDKETGRVWVHASLWPGSWSKLNTGLWASEREKMHCLVADRVGRSLNEQALEIALRGMRGHIVGSIEVTAYRTPDDPPDSPWYVPGSLAIMVRDPVPLAVPVPAKGALGWWAPNAETMARLEVAR